MDGINPMELKRRLDAGEDLFLLDVRSPKEYEEVHLDHSTLIPLGQLRSRVDEVPSDKTVVVFCKISLRGYEAARFLEGCGFDNVIVLDGGIVMWPYEKVTK